MKDILNDKSFRYFLSQQSLLKETLRIFSFQQHKNESRNKV